ncbi:MAG TPA: DUF4157 domain-containing protein [Nitrospira sp.]|nr:DUF4157 domain-containing protein [Nitrospira sp.]
MSARGAATPMAVETPLPITRVTPSLGLQRKCACGGSSGLTGFCQDCQKKKLLGKPIQAKLRINEPGDQYEQEADSVAEQVMRMPDTDMSKPPREDRAPLVQRRATNAGTEVMEAPLVVHDVLNSPGQPLDAATRAFFEPRFGHDFSFIRVHSDYTAAESARQIGAAAYTLGRHIVFDSGRFESQTIDGRQLLAHELTHAIQQEASPAPGGSFSQPTIQRALGFEFQTKNILTTNKGRKFKRKAHKYFHKGKTGVEMEADTGSVVEFETGAVSKWSQLKGQIEEAVEICRKLNATFGAKPVFSWSEEHRRDKERDLSFAFSEEPKIRKEASFGKDEYLTVEIKESSFEARIQSTEGFALAQFSSFLREHEKHKVINPVISHADRILTDARAANRSIKANADVNNLRGFLQAVISYIERGQSQNLKPDKWAPAKQTFYLMSRTSFSSMFNSILSRDEKMLFQQIVKSDAIPRQLDVDPTAPLFAEGYWGHFAGMMALFRDGQIVALGDDNNKKAIYDCMTKTRTAQAKNSKLDERHCGKFVPESNVTVGGWLASIINSRKAPDLLSPPHRGSESLGKFDVKTSGPEKGLVIFEARVPRRSRDKTMNEWVEYAEEVFQQAALCRPRPGTGTDLEYDGDKFNFGVCLPPP